MANNVTVRLDWRGPEVIAAVKKHIAGGLQGFTQDIVEEARTLSPVKTGHNKSTIDLDERGEKFRVFTASGYGAYLELGTARMAPRPYIFPAYDLRKAKFLESIKGVV